MEECASFYWFGNWLLKTSAIFRMTHFMPTGNIALTAPPRRRYRWPRVLPVALHAEVSAGSHLDAIVESGNCHVWARTIRKGDSNVACSIATVEMASHFSPSVHRLEFAALIREADRSTTSSLQPVQNSGLLARGFFKNGKTSPQSLIGRRAPYKRSAAANASSDGVPR
jgi:hypothetical protein